MSAKSPSTLQSEASEAKGVPSRKPVHEIKDGAIQVAIWLNDADGEPWYSVTTRRIYKQSDAWKESGSYGQGDVLVLAKLLDLAYNWMLLHRPQLKARRKAA